MGNIPVKSVVDTVKTHGPKVGKFLKDNWKEIGTVFTLANTAKNKINNYNSNKEEAKQKQGKTHYRKVRFLQYNTEILRVLDNVKRSELLQYKLEVSQFIQQINNEVQNEVTFKKPLHMKRIKSWNEILIQIEDKMKTKDYQEYLLIYNNPKYKSIYFEGFEVHLDKFYSILNNENNQQLFEFLQLNTGRSIEEIKRHFA